MILVLELDSKVLSINHIVQMLRHWTKWCSTSASHIGMTSLCSHYVHIFL
jgi:hypothetical protein